MEHETISALRVDLYDCDDKPPRDYIRPIAPLNAINHAWIPQTIGDQIWVLWEFNTKDEREAFEAGLPVDVSRWIDRTVIPYSLKYGWRVRDTNGFVTGLS